MYHLCYVGVDKKTNHKKNAVVKIKQQHLILVLN